MCAGVVCAGVLNAGIVCAGVVSEIPLTGKFLMDSVKNNETKETAVE